ncbi:hypothetical protein BN7874_289 [Phage NCTB]|nr:hypothetical protein BN7874_289 [Phage NCTB]
MEYTPEQKAVGFDTYQHIWHVQRFIAACIHGYLIAVDTTMPEPQDSTLISLLAACSSKNGIRVSLPSDLLSVVHNTRSEFNTPSPTLIASVMMQRMLTHDQSKLGSVEVELFTEYTPKLKTAKFGSEEYNQFLVGLKPALDNHYAHNRHHPEHYEDGVSSMTLIDVIEMMCDWAASSLRSKDGSFENSLKICKSRFELSEGMVSILRATYAAYIEPIHYLVREDYETQTL